MITVLEYFKIKKRMTKQCTICCDDCPLSNKNNGSILCWQLEMLCWQLEMEHPEKAVASVEQWGKEHPEKTYLSDFLEKHPNAELREDGIPKDICPSDLGFEDIDKKEHCCNRCVECWNQEL